LGVRANQKKTGEDASKRCSSNPKRTKQQAQHSAAHAASNRPQGAREQQQTDRHALELLVLALLVPRLEPVAFHLQLQRLKLVLQLLRSRTANSTRTEELR
jgi:hypothetical protein